MCYYRYQISNHVRILSNAYHNTWSHNWDTVFKRGIDESLQCRHVMRDSLLTTDCTWITVIRKVLFNGKICLIDNAQRVCITGVDFQRKLIHVEVSIIVKGTQFVMVISWQFCSQNAQNEERNSQLNIYSNNDDVNSGNSVSFHFCRQHLLEMLKILWVILVHCYYPGLKKVTINFFLQNKSIISFKSNVRGRGLVVVACVLVQSWHWSVISVWNLKTNKISSASMCIPRTLASWFIELLRLLASFKLKTPPKRIRSLLSICFLNAQPHAAWKPEIGAVFFTNVIMSV